MENRGPSLVRDAGAARAARAAKVIEDVSDAEVTKPAQNRTANETAMKEAPAKKKDESQPKDKSTSGAAELSKDQGGEKAPDSPSGYSRGEGQKPVSNAYRDNWNAIYAKKKKR